jgi:oligoribonuclease (3'-5' exoribonuclease)
VQGGPFPVRALPAVVWIDDEIVGNGIENETLSQVTAITFDSSLIREGGVVSVSYGEDKETRRKLPQGLQVKRGGENQ